MSWLDRIRGIEALEDGEFDAALVADMERSQGAGLSAIRII